MSLAIQDIHLYVLYRFNKTICTFNSQHSNIKSDSVTYVCEGGEHPNQLSSPEVIRESFVPYDQLSKCAGYLST